MNKVSPVPPVESLMVRVPHHDPEHGRRVMAVSLSNRQVERRYALNVGAEMNFPYPLNGLPPNPGAKTSGTG